MSATPTYDAVVEDLQIDPKVIAARPAWSFEVAERVRKHQRKALRSSVAKKRASQPASTQPPAQKSRVSASRAAQSRPQPAAAAT